MKIEALRESEPVQGMTNRSLRRTHEMLLHTASGAWSLEDPSGNERNRAKIAVEEGLLGSATSDGQRQESAGHQ